MCEVRSKKGIEYLLNFKFLKKLREYASEPFKHCHFLQEAG